MDINNALHKSISTRTIMGDMSIIPTLKIGRLNGAIIGSVTSYKKSFNLPAPGDLIHERRILATIAKLTISRNIPIKDTRKYCIRLIRLTEFYQL